MASSSARADETFSLLHLRSVASSSDAANVKSGDESSENEADSDAYASAQKSLATKEGASVLASSGVQSGGRPVRSARHIGSYNLHEFSSDDELDANEDANDRKITSPARARGMPDSGFMKSRHAALRRSANLPDAEDYDLDAPAAKRISLVASGSSSSEKSRDLPILASRPTTSSNTSLTTASLNSNSSTNGSASIGPNKRSSGAAANNTISTSNALDWTESLIRQQQQQQHQQHQQQHQQQQQQSLHAAAAGFDPALLMVNQFGRPEFGSGWMGPLIGYQPHMAGFLNGQLMGQMPHMMPQQLALAHEKAAAHLLASSSDSAASMGANSSQLSSNPSSSHYLNSSTGDNSARLSFSSSSRTSASGSSSTTLHDVSVLSRSGMSSPGAHHLHSSAKYATAPTSASSSFDASSTLQNPSSSSSSAFQTADPSQSFGNLTLSH